MIRVKRYRISFKRIFQKESSPSCLVIDEPGVVPDQVTADKPSSRDFDKEAAIDFRLLRAGCQLRLPPSLKLRRDKLRSLR